MFFLLKLGALVIADLGKLREWEASLGGGAVISTGDKFNGDLKQPEMTQIGPNQSDLA